MNGYGDYLFFPYFAMKGCYYNPNQHMMYGSSDSFPGVGPPCNYVYPGNSDTICNWGTNGILPGGGFNLNGYYWNESTVGNIPRDKQGLASVGPFTFKPKQTVPLDYCFTWARDYKGDNLSSVELLRERVSGLKPILPKLIELPVTYSGNQETGTGVSLNIYPNPVHNKATVTSDSKSVMDFHLYSIDGKCIKQGWLMPGTNILDVTTLKPGIYILKSGRWNSRIIKM